MSIIDVKVIVTGAEEAEDGVAEFWVGGEQFGRTLLRDQRTVLEIDSRAGGETWVVDAMRLREALDEARVKLTAL